MPSCPAVGCDGKMGARRSRFGKIFFSCSSYPDCDVIVNNLDDLASKYPSHPKTAYIKKGRKKRGEKKETKTKKEQPLYRLSKSLQGLLQEESLSRPNATRKIWDYIKKHKLQDPKNKRMICPNAAMKKALGVGEPFDMLKIASLLSKHLERP
jgi:DNA topoisomerase-1